MMILNSMIQKGIKTSFLIVGLIFLSSVYGQETVYLQGMAQLKKGQYAKSEASFTALLQLHPNTVEALMNRGIAQFRQRKYTLAAKDFLIADHLKPGRGTFWLAKTYVLSGNPEKAFNELKAHLISPYKKTEKEIVMDPVLSKLENTRGWRTLWKEDWYTPVEREEAEILFLLSRKKYRDALTKSNVLLNQYNEKASLYYSRSRIYWGLGNQELALEDLKKALELAPDDFEILQYRAGIYAKMGKSGEAIADYSNLLFMHPDSFNIYLKRANIYRTRREYAKAIQDIKTYMHYFPQDQEAGSLGGEISYEAGRFTETLTFLNPLLKNEKGDKSLFVSRGLTYYNLHSFTQAENDFSMALDLDPDDPNIYFNRGRTRLALKKTKKACYDFRKAYNIGNRNSLEYLQKYCNF